MFCGRGGVASGKVLREYWIFYTARRRRKKFGGFRCQNDATYTHFGFFLRSKCCHIYTFFFAVKMLQDIHIFVGFWSKCYHIYYTFGFFLDQNAATYTHLCPFFGGQNDTIYTHFVFFLIKMLLSIYTHFVFFWSKCCNIYIFVSVFGIKMLPYIHILGFFLG